MIINLIMGWIGSLLVNYLADVLPTSRKISSPYCKCCDHELSWKYYVLLSACEHCGEKPSKRHLIMFVLGPVLAGLLYFFPLGNLGNFGGLLWLIYFELIVVIDLEHRLILHPVSLVGAVLGLVFGIFTHGVWNTLIGGAAGFGIMLTFYFLGELFVRILSKSRGENIDEVALGFGDVNLSGVIGLLLGWPGVVGGIFLAILLGGIVSGVFLLIQMARKKYQAFYALPYGPFLVLSVLALLVFSRFVR